MKLCSTDVVSSYDCQVCNSKGKPGCILYGTVSSTDSIKIGKALVITKEKARNINQLVEFLDKKYRRKR